MTQETNVVSSVIKILLLFFRFNSALSLFTYFVGKHLVHNQSTMGQLKKVHQKQLSLLTAPSDLVFGLTCTINDRVTQFCVRAIDLCKQTFYSTKLKRNHKAHENSLELHLWDGKKIYKMNIFIWKKIRFVLDFLVLPIIQRPQKICTKPHILFNIPCT